MRKQLARWSLVLSLVLLGAACNGGGDGDGGEAPQTEACSSDRLQTEASIGRFAGVTRGPVLGQAKKTLTIGTFGDRTGANSQLVIPSHKGMQLAIDQANAKGDLPVTLAFKPVDNKDGNKDTAPPIAQSFIADPSVIAVLGGGFSGETGATGQLFSEANLLFFTTTATRVDLVAQGFKTFFRGVGDDDLQGKSVIPLFEALDCESVAVVNDKTAYGAGLAQVVVPAAKEAGIEVLVDEGIEPTTDYTALVDSVISKSPEALFYAGYASEFQLIARQLREKGYEGLLASGDGSKTASIRKDIGEEHAAGVVLLCPCGDPTVSDDEEAKQFTKDFQAKFNEPPGVYAAEGYDAANVTIEAIRACGKGGPDAITRACVVDEVRKSKYEGLTKTYEFQANGQVKEQNVFVFLITEDKMIEIGPVADLS